MASLHGKGADVYIAGSNSQILSSELSALLPGRMVGIRVMPLAFSEYVRFRDSDDYDTLLDDFINNGGLPAVALLEDTFPKQAIWQFIEGVLSTVTVDDILMRHSVRNVRSLSGLLQLMMGITGDRVSARRAAKSWTLPGSGPTTSRWKSRSATWRRPSWSAVQGCLIQKRRNS